MDYLTEFLRFYPQFTTSLVRWMAFDNSEDGMREWWMQVRHTVRSAGDPEGFFSVRPADFGSKGEPNRDRM